MTLIELDEHDAVEVRPGDVVLVRATVLESVPGVGARVELYSKTDQYDAWVRHDLVAALDRPDVPDEPVDGTWLVAPDTDALDGGVNVFHRDDAGAPDEPERRCPRRWQVAGTGEWVDWAGAVHRGADPSRTLHAQTATAVEVPSDVEAFVIDIMSQLYVRGVTVAQLLARMRPAGLHPDTSVVLMLLERLTREGKTTYQPAWGGRLPRWTWNTQNT